MTPINMTTAELRDRAAELREALAATEAEIAERDDLSLALDLAHGEIAELKTALAELAPSSLSKQRDRAMRAAENTKRAHDALAAKIEQVRAFAQQQHDEIKARYDLTGALDSHRHGFMCACADILAILAATPVTLVPTAEWDMLVEAYQAWKDSDYTSEQWRTAVVHASCCLISATQEVQG